MTDVTQDRGRAGVELPAADEQLVRELTERARAEGLKLTGPGGLLGTLTKMVVEGALEGELVSRERGTLTSVYGRRTMVYAVDCECGGSAA
jgi:hypothetical protein